MAIPYTYHYTGKIEKSILQFMRIFSGLQTQDGVDRDNDLVNDFRKVTVHYGAPDRVVAGVLTKNGTFVTQKLPIVTGYLTSIDIAPDSRKPRMHQEVTTYINPVTGGNEAAIKLMATPYIANIDLTIWATNPQQMYQILEQILLIFNPSISFQTSENIDDWSYITSVELIGIANEENYPSGVDDQYIIQTLNFQFEFWLNFPYKTKDKLIEEIKLNVSDETNTVVFLETATVDVNSPG